MPRRKLARRFEPRYGVSQSTLDVESGYLARELEDQLLLSTNELREKLSKLRDEINKLELELQSRLTRIPERERLALQSMLARDFWHMAMLYKTFLASSSVVEASGAVSPVPLEVDRNRDGLPFKETLFE
jgi:tetrahydromethanopterin S-methyltransferase subunit B